MQRELQLLERRVEMLDRITAQPPPHPPPLQKSVNEDTTEYEEYSEETSRQDREFVSHCRCRPQQKQTSETIRDILMGVSLGVNLAMLGLLLLHSRNK